MDADHGPGRQEDVKAAAVVGRGVLGDQEAHQLFRLVLFAQDRLLDLKDGLSPSSPPEPDLQAPLTRSQAFRSSGP
jgi:hypothetical protein